MIFTCTGGLLEHREQTGHRSEKGDPFHQRRSEDHVGTNVVRSFGLAGDAFYGTFTDLTDTDTGADRGKTCADGTKTGLSNVRQQSHHQCHNTCFFIIKKPFNSSYYYRLGRVSMVVILFMAAFERLPDKNRGQIGKNVGLDKRYQYFDQVDKYRQQDEER